MPKLNLFLSSKNADIKPSLEDLRKEIGLIRKEQTKALMLLLCNLLAHPNQSIRASRKTSSMINKRANPQGVGSRSIVSSMDALNTHGYIILEMGAYLDNKQTTISATTKLIDWFKANHWHEDDIDIFDGQYVKLRLNEDKRSFVDFEDTEYSLWLSKELEQYSSLLNKSDIRLMDKHGNIEKEYKNHCISRTFIKHKSHPTNGEFLFGGRMAPPWVNLSKEQRKRILINGEATIEIDRPASHVNAMYEVITGQPYSDGYPYDLSINGSLVPRYAFSR